MIGKTKNRLVLPQQNRANNLVRGTTCIREWSRTHSMQLHRAPITAGKPLRPTALFSRKLRDDLGRASRELTPTVPSLGIRLNCLLLPFIACTILSKVYYMQTKKSRVGLIWFHAASIEEKGRIWYTSISYRQRSIPSSMVMEIGSTKPFSSWLSRCVIVYPLIKGHQSQYLAAL